MTYQYCTLFDSLYLSRAMVMYESLLRTTPNFHLYIFAFDTKSEEILRSLELKNVTVISLSEFEDPALLAVKPSRSKGEYCWTCTPSTIFYCIEKFKLDHCTYIDADLCFFSNANVLVDEMGTDSVLITEHRYTKRYDQSATSGIYCVQFITFKNTTEGMTVLKWWRDRCLEWCYARMEDGKFGDQKYLDDWTTRFKGVHVLKHLGGGVAPWNVQQYKVEKKGDDLMVRTSNDSAKLVFYHFHHVKFYENDNVDLHTYELSPDVMKYIYQPYISNILKVERTLQDKFQFARRTQKYIYRNKFLTPLHQIARKLQGTYNVYSINEILDGKTH